MEIHEVVTVARSPWQNAYAERLIGSIRRECLDHIIIGNARGRGLRRVLNAYVQYYLKSRTQPVARQRCARLATGRVVATRDQTFHG